MRLIIFAITLFLACYGPLYSFYKADSTSAIRVDSIAIRGNDITEEEVILRELTFKKNDLVTLKALAFNRERIYSLGLFTNVDVYADSSDGLSLIKIVLKESWYIWPIPFISIRENQLRKTTFGLDLLILNFRGRDERLKTTVALGYDPSVSVNYYNPWIGREHNVYFSSGMAVQSFQNKSKYAKNLYGNDFNYKLVTGYVALGKRLNIFNSLELLSGFDYISMPEYRRGLTASNHRIDRLIKTIAAYNLDTRDLKQFPDSGVYFRLSYERKGFGLNKADYAILRTDARHYFNLIDDIYAKWRLSARMTFGNNIPSYDFSYLNYGENIRGHSGNYREGRNSFVGSAELRYPIIKEWNVSFDLPLIPTALTTYRVAISMSAFADAGTVTGPKQRPRSYKFDSGYGMGLIFLVLPYNAFRIEYAQNQYGKGEINAAFGFSF